jgi:hypothetical protein
MIMIRLNSSSVIPRWEPSENVTAQTIFDGSDTGAPSWIADDLTDVAPDVTMAAEVDKHHATHVLKALT